MPAKKANFALDLTVTIKGHPRAGKTCLAHKIGALLAAEGHDVLIIAEAGSRQQMQLPVAGHGARFTEPRRVLIKTVLPNT